jgi:PIN domain nuclease of toxin-antitoxin system
MKYVVDTHALIWFLEGNSRLGMNAKAILVDPTSDLVLPAIVLAEAMWIVERGKTSIPDANSLLHAISNDPRISIYALDQVVIEQSMALLTINEMHDRQIVATALVLQRRGESITLLTRDQNITAAALVPIVW